MYKAHKSATCCYCGTKSILSLGGKDRHELKCTACGAPLSRMKALREDHGHDPYLVNGKRSRERYAPPKQKKKKKRKSAAKRLLDVAEDIFDIFD